jgi:phenylpropionate dioxygenase-like ring-hydroxylating dioxygenase large terminal subunit
MDSATVEKARIGLDSEYGRYVEGRPADFPQLANLPAGRYTDTGFYQLEMDHFWTRTWLLAGHVGELPEQGSYKVWNNLGWPIVLVRGADDKIRAFHNVCRHRGGAFVSEPQGKMKVFSCHFHGWTYGLDGKFKGMPVPQDFPGFNTEENGLLPVRCEMWGSLIFINRDMTAPSLMTSFGPRVTGETQDYDFDQRLVFHKSRHDVLTNWKYVHEAFRDVYHSYTVHANSFAPALKRGSTYMSMLDAGHARMITKMRDDAPDSLATNPMYSSANGDPRHQFNREAIIVFLIYPNVACSFGENEFALFAMWPKGPLETFVDVYFLTKPEKGIVNQERCDRFVQEFVAVMDEDIDNCRRCADGLNGGALNDCGFNMGYDDRLVYHWHEAIDRTIGMEKIPEKLRVQKMLQPYHER